MIEYKYLLDGFLRATMVSNAWIIIILFLIIMAGILIIVRLNKELENIGNLRIREFEARMRVWQQTEAIKIENRRINELNTKLKSSILKIINEE